MERPSLYVVATPIGNLADITLRALDVLKRVDVIAAEDTRLASRLLKHHDITTRLMAVHEHNERGAAQKIVQLLAQGKSVALISDAGTPAISDPGALAVAAVREAGYPAVPVPGANAALCALSAAGLAAPHFLFYGFLPAQAAARKRELAALKALPYLLVFYEAPHRVVASIADIAAVLGDMRKITIARELTKLFETIHTCSLGEAAEWFAQDANQVKGEFVLLVDGAPAGEAADDGVVRRVLAALMRELPLKQAVKLAADITEARKNDVYELALRMKKNPD
ncbi:MAG: 16S rRNA (cytidine(1402)-2'-O)-methyltransferase [Betaproteobacteria bacterium]|nr:16S rRNA (cytidine(1402)-2'-O)-methyltransferase [Betaproteobacteria bacterium]